MRPQVLVGDCLHVMPGLEPASIDAIVTDPPYGLEFMGKEWDRLRVEARWCPYCEGAGRVPFPEPQDCPACTEGLRDEPGGYRERGRMNKGQGLGGYTERPNWYQGGLELQLWHYEWACEAYRVAKPGAHLVAFGGTRTFHRLACALEDAGWEIRDCLMWLYGTGFPKSDAALKPAWEPIILVRKPLEGTVAENVLEHGTGGLNIDATRTDVGRWPANLVLDEATAAMIDVSRFFYTAKAARSERGDGNTHPTVKPFDLMRWLVRLVTPSGGLVLDPFAGSGTTLLAARAEGCRSIGIERKAQYVSILQSRLSDGPLF